MVGEERRESQKNLQSIERLDVCRTPGEGAGFHEVLGKPFDDVISHT